MKRSALLRLIAITLLPLFALAGCYRDEPVAATPSSVLTLAPTVSPSPVVTASPVVTPSPVPLYPPLWDSIYSSPAEREEIPKELGLPFVMYYWNDYGTRILILDEAFAEEFITLSAQAEAVHRGEDYDRMSVFVYPEGYTELPYNLLTDEAGGYQLDTGDRFIQADALCATLLELLEEERGVCFTPRLALQGLTAASVYYRDDLLAEQTDREKLTALEELIQTATARGAPRQCSCALTLLLTTADGSTYTLGLDILNRAVSLSYGQHFYFGSIDDEQCVLALLDMLGLTLPSIDAIDYPYPTHASP